MRSSINMNSIEPEKKDTHPPDHYPSAGKGKAKGVDPEYEVSETTFLPPAEPRGKLSGAAKVVAGGVCVAVGVPMLILPGPGLLAIGGGVALVTSGASELLGKRKK